jgi:uncharacterized protein (DUF1778 family)
MEKIATVYTINTQRIVMKSEVVNLRLTEEQKQAIDYAASQAGVSRTEFMVQASVQRAHENRYDQVLFTLPREDFDYLMTNARSPRSGSKQQVVDRLKQVELPWEK